MKKIALNIIALSNIYCAISNAGSMGPINEYNWNGFYLGANAGYWWSKDNTIHTAGSPSFVNPLDPVGAGNIANALAGVGTNRLSNDLDGILVGGQAGYNRQVGNRVVVGLDLGISALNQADDVSSVNKVVPLVDFPESYSSTLTVKKRIDYLGAARGRFGVLFSPSLLIYGIGGLAFGEVTLNECFIANESLGTFAYPTVFAEEHTSRTRGGWTLGAGGEWMFKPQWTAKIEYAYYDLGKVKNRNVVLSQINNLQIPAATWGTANVSSSSTKFTLGTVSLGVSYHMA